MKDTSKPMRVALYIRFATEAQFNDTAMECQSALLHEQAECQGFKIVGEVRAYEKGTTLNRPGWRNVVKLAVEQQADILVKDVCRVTRRMDLLAPFLSELDKQGISIYTCDNGLLQIPETKKRLMEYLAQACK